MLVFFKDLGQATHLIISLYTNTFSHTVRMGLYVMYLKWSQIAIFLIVLIPLKIFFTLNYADPDEINLYHSSRSSRFAKVSFLELPVHSIQRLILRIGLRPTTGPMKMQFFSIRSF